MTGLRTRGRDAWLTPKPGTPGATTGLSMFAAGAPTTGTTTTTLAITSSSSGDGQATLTWATTIGSDGLNVTGVRTGRNGIDATGTGPWSTDDPVNGTRTFTLLTNGTPYTLSAQLLVNGTLYGTAQTVTVNPTGSGVTTPPPVVVTPPPDSTGPVVTPSHPPASVKIATIGMPTDGLPFWSGGRGDGIGVGNNNFANFRGKAINMTSTWQDTANGAVWFDWGITSANGDPYDNTFPGLLDVAIGGPSDYNAAAGGSLDARHRQMFTNIRNNRMKGGATKPRPTVIRACHELNGTWYPWSVRPGMEAIFLTYMRRIRKILDETFPEALFQINFNGDQNSGVQVASLWDPSVFDLIGVDYYNQYPYIGTSRTDAPYEPGKFTSWDDGAYRGTIDQPRGIERWRQFAEKRGVPLIIPEWATSVSAHGVDPYFTNQVYPWIRQHAGMGAGQIFGESWFNIWAGYNSVFQIYVDPGSGGQVLQPAVASAYANFFKALPPFDGAGGAVTPTPPATGGTTTPVGPVSAADVNELVSRGLITVPADANLVMWRWPTGTDLNTVFAQLAPNDILVLPEDVNPYVVGQMYRTSNGTVNGTNPTTDRAACRSRRGIIGLGPNAVIAPSAGFPTYGAQTGSDGVRESLVENWTANSYHANFTIKGRNVGGLAYHALKLEQANNGVVERVKTVNHYGFLGMQPGEAFGILVQNQSGAFTLRNCEVDGSNPATGVKEGTGGIHLVRGGDVVVDNCYIHDTRGSGIAHYWRLGNTTINDVRMARLGDATVQGRGINVEVCGTTTITVNRPNIQLNRANQPHIAVVSANVSGAYGAWPLGRTQVYVNNPTFDQGALQVWTANGGAGTYAGAPNVAQPADVHVSPAGTAVNYAGFQ